MLAVGVGHSLTTASVSVVPLCRVVPSRGLDAPHPLAFASVAVAVGHSDDENPAPPMRGANVSRANPQGACSIAEPLKVGEDRWKPESCSARNVLDDDPLGPELADEAGELSPEPTSFTGEPAPPSGDGHILAREPSAQDSNASES